MAGVRAWAWREGVVAAPRRPRSATRSASSTDDTLLLHPPHFVGAVGSGRPGNQLSVQVCGMVSVSGSRLRAPAAAGDGGSRSTARRSCDSQPDRETKATLPAGSSSLKHWAQAKLLSHCFIAHSKLSQHTTATSSHSVQHSTARGATAAHGIRPGESSPSLTLRLRRGAAAAAHSPAPAGARG